MFLYSVTSKSLHISSIEGFQNICLYQIRMRELRPDPDPIQLKNWIQSQNVYKNRPDQNNRIVNCKPDSFFQPSPISKGSRKKSIFSSVPATKALPPTPTPLELSGHICWGDFLELQKSSYLLVAMPLHPRPTKKRFFCGFPNVM